MSTTSVDERGRVVIPRELREEFGLQPGQPAVVERTTGGVVVRPARPTAELLDRLEGAITKHARGARIDPMRLKEIWTDDLPRRR